MTRWFLHLTLWRWHLVIGRVDPAPAQPTPCAAPRNVSGPCAAHDWQPDWVRGYVRCRRCDALPHEVIHAEAH